MTLSEPVYEYTCVECGAPAKDLYHKYGPEVLKVSHCQQCGHVVDKYIECDNVLLGLDLLLHKLAAFRHLVCNTVIDARRIARLLVLLVLCEAYILWIQTKDFVRDSQEGRLYFTAAMEFDFYAQLITVILRVVFFFTTLAAIELSVSSRVNLLRLFKMVILLGYCRILLVPVISWRSFTETDVYSFACATVTFTTCYQGLRALTGMHPAAAVLESLSACFFSSVMSRHGMSLMLAALGASGFGGLGMSDVVLQLHGETAANAASQSRPTMSFSFAQ